MRFRTTAIIAIIFFASLWVIGFFNASNRSQVGPCRNCWSNSAIEVTSELCPTDEPCIAEPFLQQHNAVVDTLLCACTNAGNSGYADASTNKQIEDAYFAMRGGCTDDVLSVPVATREANGIFCADLQPDRVGVQDLCTSPDQYLAKRSY